MNYERLVHIDGRFPRNMPVMLLSKKNTPEKEGKRGRGGGGGPLNYQGKSASYITKVPAWVARFLHVCRGVSAKVMWSYTAPTFERNTREE